MRFGILGPIEAWDEAGPLRIGGPRERKLLATLLLNATRSVSVPRLTMAMWGDDQPVTARAQVHNSIAALRRNLVTAGGDHVSITRSDGGFLIGIDGEQLDATRYAQRVDAGERLAESGRTVEAVDLLGSALSLWRGPALGGMDSGPLAGSARRLNEQRLACLERHLTLSLELGRHAELAGELTALIAEHPLRERLVELRMLALYRAGRRQDALELYAETRRRLAEQAGLDPRTELDQLHQAILRADPGLDLPRAAPPTLLTRSSGSPSATRSAGGTPTQLPADAAGFTGRRDEQAALDLVVADRNAGKRPHAIAAIVGAAGIGKTALAVRWAYQRLDAFPDGQLYVDLHGFGHREPLTPLEVLGRLLRGLGKPEREIATDLDERSAQYRSLLSGQRVLVLLDNAASSEQVRPMLSGAGQQTILVTSRRRLDGLIVHEGVRQLTLAPLPEEDAAELVRAAGGPADGENEAITALARLCDRLPLALRIAAARLAARDDQTVAGLVEELTDEQSRLSGLSLASADAAVRTAFASSYQTLPPDAQRLLRTISLHHGPELSNAACAASADLAPAETATLIDALLTRHVLTQVSPRRYRQHDLIRLYAHEQALAIDSDADRAGVEGRILTWYLRTADTADHVLRPYRTMPFTVPPADRDDAGVGFGNEIEALAWFDLEAPNLTMAVAAAERTHPALCWRLAAVMYAWLERRQRRSDWLDTFTIGARAAAVVGDLPGEALMRQALGVCLCYLNRQPEAVILFEQVVEARRRIGDPRALAAALMNLGNQYVETGRGDEGLTHLTESLRLVDTLPDNLASLGMGLNNLGWAHYRAERLDDAIECYQRSAAIAREIHNPQTVSFAEGNLANVRAKQGRPADALDHWRQSLLAARTAGDRRLEGNSLAGVAKSRIALGDVASVHVELGLALAIFRELDDPDADEIQALLAAHPEP